MNIIEETDKIEYLTPLLENKKYNSSTKIKPNKEVSKILIELYRHLEDGVKYLQNEISNNNINTIPSIIKISKKDNIPDSFLLNSIFISNEVKKFLKNNCKYELQFKFNLFSREIIIHFICFDENIDKDDNTYKNNFFKIYLWLYIINKYSSSKCVDTLNIYLYLSDFKKILPDNNVTILDAHHVNSGFSTVCIENSSIVIYRKEEWFKVFIHETMHNFGLEFSTLNIENANKKLKDIFPVSFNILLFESYCEFWARTINILFKCYFEKNDIRENKNLIIQSKKLRKTRKNKINVLSIQEENFIKCFYDLLNKEIQFSIYQCIKVLDFMGLDYDIITSNSDTAYITVKMLYKEKTNVFPYYIITAIIISNFNTFMLWCKSNNSNILQFTQTNESINNFVNFIKENYRNNELLEKIIHTEKILHDHINIYQIDSNNNENNKIKDYNLLLNTMRMTIFG